MAGQRLNRKDAGDDADAQPAEPDVETVLARHRAVIQEALRQALASAPVRTFPSAAARGPLDRVLWPD